MLFDTNKDYNKFTTLDKSYLDKIDPKNPKDKSKIAKEEINFEKSDGYSVQKNYIFDSIPFDVNSNMKNFP